jgi:hypothetical protein
MFIGHYSASFAGKAVDRTIPLWVLFVAVQLLDFVWAILILLGIEHVRIVPGFMAASALDLYDMPYTHSLAGALVLSIIGGALFCVIWKRAWTAGLIVGLAVFSHWILDLIVHGPDLVIYGTHKMGFGLWNYFWPEFVLECALLIGTILWYLRGVSLPATKRRAWVLFAILIAFQCIDKFGPPPTGVKQAAGSALVAYTLLAIAATRVDKSDARPDPH